MIASPTTEKDPTWVIKLQYELKATLAAFAAIEALRKAKEDTHEANRY